MNAQTVTYQPARLGHGTAVHLVSGKYPMCGHVNTHVWKQPTPKPTDLPVSCKKCLAILAKRAA